MSVLSEPRFHDKSRLDERACKLAKHKPGVNP